MRTSVCLFAATILLAGCAAQTTTRGSWIDERVSADGAETYALAIARMVSTQLPAAQTTIVLDAPTGGTANTAVANAIEERLRWAGFGVTRRATPSRDTPQTETWVASNEYDRQWGTNARMRARHAKASETAPQAQQVEGGVVVHYDVSMLDQRTLLRVDVGKALLTQLFARDRNGKIVPVSGVARRELTN